MRLSLGFPLAIRCRIVFAYPGFGRTAVSKGSGRQQMHVAMRIRAVQIRDKDDKQSFIPSV
jgi:hypothetical protein